MSSDDRENFSKPTKDFLAERAGHRCCVPGCATRTIGPGASPDETARIGVACHIFSAAPDGPRGRGGLTPEQLRGPENGFWACPNHARLIDTNDGKQFPAETLLRWRTSSAARARREMAGLPLPDFWIESITVDGNVPRIFGHGQTLELSRVTLLIGGNGAGKSTLCEWLAGGLDSRWQKRWHARGLRIAIALHSPAPHLITLEHGDGQTVFTFDGTRLPVNPVPVLVQMVTTAPFRAREPEDEEDGTRETDVAFLARWLHCDEGALRGLIPHLDYHRHPLLRGIRLRIDEPGKILARLREVERELRFDQLSCHERERVALTVAIARADAAGSQAASLLIVDGILPFFDPAIAQAVLETLRQMHHVQSIVTLVGKLDPRVPGGGWSTVALRPRPGGATIAPL